MKKAWIFTLAFFLGLLIGLAWLAISTKTTMDLSYEEGYSDGVNDDYRLSLENCVTYLCDDSSSNIDCSYTEYLDILINESYPHSIANDSEIYLNLSPEQRAYLFVDVPYCFSILDNNPEYYNSLKDSFFEAAEITSNFSNFTKS